MSDACSACGTRHDRSRPHEAVAKECHEARPRCRVPECLDKTCIQAMVGEGVPECLDHFFEPRADRAARRQLELTPVLSVNLLGAKTRCAYCGRPSEREVCTSCLERLECLECDGSLSPVRLAKSKYGCRASSCVAAWHQVYDFTVQEIVDALRELDDQGAKAK